MATKDDEEQRLRSVALRNARSVHLARQRAEQSLHESEERYRSLMQALTSIVWTTDAVGRFVVDQPAWTRYAGQTWEQLRDAVWTDVLHPDDRARVRAVWDAACAAKALYRSEGRLWHAASASYRHFEARAVPMFNADGSLREWVGTCTDVEDHWQAEQKLRESEQRLRFIMDSMPQKIFTATPNGDVDYFNPVWMAFTGLSFDQIRQWGWTQFIHPDDVAANVRGWQHALDSGEEFVFEHRFRHWDGHYRWHLSRALPMRDGEGKIAMWIGSNTDIHDVKEADRRKDEFLAMLAHELRNPLAPIRNAAQVLRLTQGNREAVRAASEMLERQVGHMVRLVDDLLDVSRVSRGKIELRRGRIEMASTVNHAVESARVLCNSMGHELTVVLPPEPMYLNADPIRLAQVVGNLLNNACKFTDKGGRIELTVEREGDLAVIRVRDSGIGIAAEQLPRVFDLFTQVDTSLERSRDGLGIGLTLVKNIVELHGGTAQVHSAGLGQGSEFAVRLPIMGDAPKPAQPEPLVAAPPAPKPRRILVVDDNRDSALSLAMVLTLTGHETQTAGDGLEAVQAASQFKPDVVLLDLGLPKLNGYEACRRIREQPWSSGMVLVALTGWGQEEDRKKSADAGFDAHMVKPVALDALMELLASVAP